MKYRITVNYNTDNDIQKMFRTIWYRTDILGLVDISIPIKSVTLTYRI